MTNPNQPNITAFKPSNPAGYSPNHQADHSQPFKEEGVPVTGNIVPTLLRLAMRRLPGFGYGAVHGKAPSVVKNAVTIGSHGKLT